MQNHKVPFNGKSLSATTMGNAANKAILLIHGNSMSSKIWQKQYDSSLSTNYYLVSYDLPGHGQSDNLDKYSLYIMAESILAIINHFKLKNYIVAGNSLGGDLILQSTKMLNDCKGIILINTPPVPRPPAMEKTFQANPLIGAFFTKECDSANLEALTGLILKDTKNIPSFVKPDFERTDGNMRQALAESVATLNYFDEVVAAKELIIPIAIITGKDEMMINNDYYASLDIPKLWQNKVQVVEKSAHCPQWENSEMFNTILKNFRKEA